MSFLFFDTPLFRDFDRSLPLPPLFPFCCFLPLPSVLSILLEDSPAFFLRISSLRIRLRILSNDSLVPFVELLTAVTVPNQLSDSDDKSNNACTSSSNLISTDASLVKMELNSLMWSVAELPCLIFKFTSCLIRNTLLAAEGRSYISDSALSSPKV